ncbi:MAG: enoyl-CoA hydratase/isomerase family protein [Pseudomonadota bacterium]
MTTEDMGKMATSGAVIAERRGAVGLITLNRPKALNALSLEMIRDITAALVAWRDDPLVTLVAVRGTNKVGKPGTAESLFGNFCAGGDIRFFHEAALAGDKSLDDFFTEEYRLNFLIQTYPKAYVTFLDGVVMGGGMGLCQGGQHPLRIATERTKMAMPETNIGLFPDVGGGYFLSRCPGHVGEYLAMTGEVIGADAAMAYGLADIKLASSSLPALWQGLGTPGLGSVGEIRAWISGQDDSQRSDSAPQAAQSVPDRARVDSYFSLARVKHIVDALEASDDIWAKKTAVVLRKRSPLMLHVALEQVRRARSMSLADELRMERVMVHQCFYSRPPAESETVEGIRALAVDKDYSPKWKPARIDDVKPAMINAFFESPWAPAAHPLADL